MRKCCRVGVKSPEGALALLRAEVEKGRVPFGELPAEDEAVGTASVLLVVESGSTSCASSLPFCLSRGPRFDGIRAQATFLPSSASTLNVLAAFCEDWQST